ncbi:hypothetical protein AB9K41_13770 [Cribrihabitans sp. XS_ASV171]
MKYVSPALVIAALAMPVHAEDINIGMGDRQVIARDRKWECATVCHAAMLFAQSFQRSNAAARL